MLTFQQIILKLQSYWDAQGCALLQPYDMEVGAGTSHTATFLRALGPEPWGLLCSPPRSVVWKRRADLQCAEVRRPP